MKLKQILGLMLLVALVGCGASKTADGTETSLGETLDKKNRATITLLDQIRRLPGITLRNGVPVFNKTNNSLASNGNAEPLYVLNDYIVGNSFRSVDQLVQNVDVDKIETFTGPDASFYGTRGANGVIKITTNR
ncbi:MAG: hypothetical protein AB3N14_13350 [Flavobacteriaceae bacterium]